MHKLYEMINQELKADGRKYQVLPNFGICYEELSKLRILVHANAVSTLSPAYEYVTYLLTEIDA